MRSVLQHFFALSRLADSSMSSKILEPEKGSLAQILLMLSFHCILPAGRNGKPTLPSPLFCFSTVLPVGCICFPFSRNSSCIQASSFIICLGHYHFTGWTPLVKEACYPSQVKEDGHLKIIPRDALLLDGLTQLRVLCPIMCLM